MNCNDAAKIIGFSVRFTRNDNTMYYSTILHIYLPSWGAKIEQKYTTLLKFQQNNKEYYRNFKIQSILLQPSYTRCTSGPNAKDFAIFVYISATDARTNSIGRHSTVNNEPWMSGRQQGCVCAWLCVRTWSLCNDRYSVNGREKRLKQNVIAWGAGVTGALQCIKT